MSPLTAPQVNSQINQFLDIFLKSVIIEAFAKYIYGTKCKNFIFTIDKMTFSE